MGRLRCGSARNLGRSSLGRALGRHTGRAVGPIYPRRHNRPEGRPEYPRNQRKSRNQETTEIPTAREHSPSLSTHFSQSRFLATAASTASLFAVMAAVQPETGQGGRVSPSTSHAPWRTVMRNYPGVRSCHKSSILFCHTINQTHLRGETDVHCIRRQIRIQPPGVWQISYTFFHRPTTTAKTSFGVELYIPLVTFEINEG